jgi:hypothetical protein
MYESMAREYEESQLTDEDLESLNIDDSVESQYTPMPQAFYGMSVTEGGQDPEVVAAMFGYDSAIEMITEIIQTTSLTHRTKELAESRMDAEHGNILNDGTMELEAYLASHNEQRGRMILKELGVLARENNVAVLERQVERAAAKAEIDALRVTEISASRDKSSTGLCCCS